MRRRRLTRAGVRFEGERQVTPRAIGMARRTPASDVDRLWTAWLDAHGGDEASAFGSLLLAVLELDEAS